MKPKDTDPGPIHKGEPQMKLQLVKTAGAVVTLGVIVMGGMLIVSPRVHADDNDQKDQESKIQIGFQIAPVKLNLAGKDRSLVGRTPYPTPGPGDLERPGQTAGTYIHNPQGASSPMFVTVAADKGVPFKGSLEGIVTPTPIDPQFLSELTKGTGDATQLGRFTFVRPETVNLLTFTSIGSFAFTAANGDILTADFTGQGSPTATPGVLSIVETAFISGGTGRFAGATGSFIVTSSFDLATNLTAGSFAGTISSPGANHASLSAAVFQN
jgi:hypothetical protein